ncbi:GGDEF domain-containing protein [Pseudidiomarina mangrovi]|uniref:GGDEF domain-containing protein n=1 Tax=Pseudidiomarina mangrovi TaxID=2487133 RepID=UPI000FC9C7F1|nr:GGDEF domain-containing protein [Pseudidiomarina mangrovi]CAI8156238.1 MAG: putative diguanylate cyclase AdrA [Pseudidiomarina mangrovi]
MPSAQLDILTIIALLALGYFVIAGLLYLNKHQYSDRQAVTLWTCAQLAKGIGAAGVMLAVALDSTVVRIALNLFLFLGFALEFAAYRLYAGRMPIYRWPVLLMLIGSVVFVAGFVIPEPLRGNWWAATAAINFAVFTFCSATTLWRWRQQHRISSNFVNVIIVTYYLHFVICILRAWYAVLIDGHNFVTPVLTNQLMLVWNFIIMLLNGLGFVLLLKERADEQLLQLTIRDALTGIYNRRHFDEQIHIEFARAQRNQEPLALAFMDLDNFKELNDQFGHQCGDQALIKFSEFVQRRIRTSDIWVRLGGDEFALLMPASTAKQAGQKLERLRVEFSHSLHQLGEHRLQFSFSAGIADSESANNVDDLIGQADQVLYQVKQAGRDQVASTELLNVAP